jgi:alpha-D-ribose 1-methylphosphonate 5-triphosphate synthase subunit PhnG
MSFAEMKESLSTLSASERAELHEHLQAMEEGVSIEELRAIKATLDEELNDPSPELTLEEVRASVEAAGRSDAAST